MRLIRCDGDDFASDDLVLEEFHGQHVPEYAILSHTWGQDEVLFLHAQTGTARVRQGYTKIKRAIQEAVSLGMRYIWVDTCCIDKSSSAELSEAINSMFHWYQNAKVCLAHLADLYLDSPETVPFAHVRQCRWFTRGWCLQELVAPSRVLFYAADWIFVGTKQTWAAPIAAITGIEPGILEMTKPVRSSSIAQRMSWAAKRQTNRPEDMAYSLMGIFGVNMPLLYGEGSQAFRRLQKEILRVSDDESLFAWTDPEMTDLEEHGLLADTPAQFARSGNIVPYRMLGNQNPWQMTNRGLKLNLSLVSVWEQFDVLGRRGHYVAALDCPVPDAGYTGHLAIVLYQPPGHDSDGSQEYKRSYCNTLIFTSSRGDRESIYVRQEPTPALEDLVYPLHCFLLDSLEDPEFEIIDLKFLDPGPTVTGQLTEHLVEYLGDAWLPSRFPKVVKIEKRRGKLSAAILFRRLVDDLRFTVLLGALTDLEVGVEMIAWPEGDELPKLDELEQRFNLQPLGLTRHLDESFELTVLASCSAMGDIKCYEVFMDRVDDQDSPKDSFDTESESKSDDDIESD